MAKLTTITNTLNQLGIIATYMDGAFFVHHKDNTFKQMDQLHNQLLGQDINFIANWNRFIINLELN